MTVVAIRDYLENDEISAFLSLDEALAKAMGAKTCLNPEFSILLELYRAEQRGEMLSVSSIGLESGIPPSTVLRYLSIFEGRGWISRRPHQSDGRIQLVRISQSVYQEVKLSVSAVN